MDIPSTRNSFRGGRSRKNWFDRENEEIIESKPVRKRWFKIRVTVDELKKIKALSKTTVCKNASRYARNKLLQKPVIVKYRNTSADDILSEMIRLKKELNVIGNNFNQAVKKLFHT